MKEESNASVTAPLKLIITGEHAVVYGLPALVTSLGEYTRASVYLEGDVVVACLGSVCLEKKCDELSAYGLEISRQWDVWNSSGKVGDPPHVEKKDGLFVIISEFFHYYNREIEPLRLVVDNDLMPGSGLGHSASFSAAVSIALAQALSIRFSNEDIEQIVLNCERRFAGNPSGVDQAAVLHGGSFIYMKDQKDFTYLNLDMDFMDDFSVVYTGPSVSTTAQAVSHVRSQFENGVFKQQMLDSFEDVINGFISAIQDTHTRLVIDYCNENHRLLTRLGLSSQIVDGFCEEIISIGGACKLTGAGTVVGDSVGALLVYGVDKNVLDTICKKYSYSLLNASISVNGVF